MAIDINQTLDSAAAQKLLAGAVDWTQYDGLRVASHSSGAIYLVMWGQLHWIPNPPTFNTVFKDWSGIVNSDYIVDNMPRGPALAVDSLIAIGAGSPAQYLVTFGKKLWIPNPATVAKFNFHAPVTIPHLVLDYVPTGPNVT